MNVIDKAIERLQGNWHQGSYGDVGGDGPVCAIGAVLSVAGSTWNSGLDDWDYPPAAESSVIALAHALACEVETDHISVASFNDDPATTEEDVLLLMKKASAHQDGAA